MKILKINPRAPRRDSLQKVAKILNKGGVVVLPTDTAYALCANAMDPKAIEKVFILKKRPKNKPLSVMVRNIEQAKSFAHVTDQAEKLFKKFLGKPLTIVLFKKRCVPDILTAGEKSIGVRIPAYKIVQEILKRVRFALTATSANVSGKSTPYSITTILKQYKKEKKEPDLIVDAGRLFYTKPSTVVDLTKKSLRLIRRGPVSLKEIIKTLKHQSI